MIQNFKKLSNFKYFDVCLDICFVFIAIFIAIYAREAFVNLSGALGYYFFNGSRILTTNDAYHFANATKDLIEWHIEDGFYPIASLELPSILSAFLYYILPFNLDNLFFLLPIGLSSLIAIPVYLFTKDLTNRYFAFMAAILAPLCVAYTNRTSAGYYDTDMLVLVLPLFGLFFLFRLLQTYSFKNLLLAVIFFTLSLLWHKVSATYILTTSVFLALFWTILANRKSMQTYESLGILLVAIAYYNIFIKLIILAILLHFMSPKPLLFRDITLKIKPHIKHFSILVFLIGLSIFILTNADLITSRFATYITDEMIATSSITPHSTAGTIEELKPLELSNIATYIIKDKTSFVIGFIGSLLMFIRHPRSIILLPFLLLGLISMKLGNRFSMFATPIISIGFFYGLSFVLSGLRFIFIDKIALKCVQTILAISFGLFVILPNYFYTKNFLLPPTIFGFELKALDEIKKDSHSREDLSIAWWDYGFAVPYFSQTRPIVQGTDLDGINQFLASFVLSSNSQYASYNMSKLIAEARDSTDKSLEKYHILDKIIYRYNANNDPKAFIESLSNPNFKTPTITKNIYIYLPLSLLAIQTALDEFSDIDYKTGEVIHKNKTLAQYANIETKEDSFILDGQLTFFFESGIIQENESGKSMQVQKFHTITRDKTGLQTTTKTYTEDKTKIHIIYSKDLNMFFAIDDRTNNSLTVQLFIYENYDKNLFELIYSDKYSKAYKLK